MRYRCEWAVGQWIYLENVASQTRITLNNSSIGQQQESSSSVQTGHWTAPPEVLRSSIGVVVKLFTAQGERFMQIQGTSVSPCSEVPGETQSLPVKQVAKVPDSHLPASTMPASTMPASTMPASTMPASTMPASTMPASTMPASTMPPMSPPLPPMRMGGMQMDQTAMTMQMGGMRLTMPIDPSIDSSHQTMAAEQPEPAKGQRNFCSQCGSVLKPSDRFCASCGHRLT